MSATRPKLATPVNRPHSLVLSRRLVAAVPSATTRASCGYTSRTAQALLPSGASSIASSVTWWTRPKTYKFGSRGSRTRVRPYPPAWSCPARHSATAGERSRISLTSSAFHANIPGLALVRDNAQCDATMTLSFAFSASAKTPRNHPTCVSDTPPPQGMMLSAPPPSPPFAFSIRSRMFRSISRCSRPPTSSANRGLSSVVSRTTSLQFLGSAVVKYAPSVVCPRSSSASARGTHRSWFPRQWYTREDRGPACSRITSAILRRSARFFASIPGGVGRRRVNARRTAGF